MKRIIALLLALLLIPGLSGCGKSEEVLSVEEAITGLGDIDRECGDAISAAEDAYNALPEKEKGDVENAEALKEARVSFDRLMAEDVSDIISGIGTVTEKSLPDIQAAEEAYNKLTEAQKEYVSNYSVISESYAAYDALLAEKVEALIDKIDVTKDDAPEQIRAAEDAYNALTDGQKDLVKSYDTLAGAWDAYIDHEVSPVEELIDAAAAFDLTGDSVPDGALDAVNSAQKAYDALDDALKEEVENRDKLTEAQKRISEIRVTGLVKMIDEYFKDKEVTLNATYSLVITACQKAYESLSDEEKALITNYDLVEKAAERYEELLNKPPVTLISYTMQKDSIGDPELTIFARNDTDSIIKDFTIVVYAYDNDGVPVKVYFNNFYKSLKYSNALKPGERTKSNSYWTLYGDYSEIKQIVAVLARVNYYDGTTWENPQLYMLHERYNEKLLPAGDEGVLPRG